MAMSCFRKTFTLWLGLIFTVAGTGNGLARRAWAKHESGLSVDIDLDYDGSRHRTNAFHFGTEVEWGNLEEWVSLSFDTYSDFKSGWRMRQDAYSTLELGKALWRDNDARLYINASVEIDAHSYLASTGWDISPEVAFVKGLNDDWWVGATISGSFATSPDEGYLAGYGSLSLWATWLCGWMPDEEDSLSLSIWMATNEDPDAGRALFIGLEYEFDLTESVQATVGVGTDPYTPWDHLGAYASAGLRWSF